MIRVRPYRGLLVLVLWLAAFPVAAREEARDAGPAVVDSSQASTVDGEPAAESQGAASAGVTAESADDVDSSEMDAMGEDAPETGAELTGGAEAGTPGQAENVPGEDIHAGDEAGQLPIAMPVEPAVTDPEPPTPVSGGDSTESTLQILGAEIRPGEKVRVPWIASETFYGTSLETPVNIIHGQEPGLTLCLTAAIHGDELNGVEIVRRLVDSISAQELSGTVIGVPIVNLFGFTRGSRYLPDRRDLNRYFPGNPAGSSASRIAYSFFREVIGHCDRLVDLHTGSLNRTNLPQLRADLYNPAVVEFTTHFGSTAVLHSRNVRGNLRRAAVDVGIPAVVLELGEPNSLQQEHVEYGVKALETLLDKLGMIKRRRFWSVPQPVYYSSRWVRVDEGGLLTTSVSVGARVREGSTLGIVVNPLTSESSEILSPYNGRVLGMSLNQFMLPGYAAFRIGIVADEVEDAIAAQTFDCTGIDFGSDELSDEFDCTPEGEQGPGTDFNGGPGPESDDAGMAEQEPH